MRDHRELKSAIVSIRESGRTVKWWASNRGFHYQTVVKVLNGYTGKRQIGVTSEIIRALTKDGYLKKAERIKESLQEKSA